jgi:hypothetical protein
MFDHLKAPALYGSAARALIIKALGELSMIRMPPLHGMAA